MAFNEKAWHVGFKWTIGNEDVPTGAFAVDNFSKQLHICDIEDVRKDWNVGVMADPALYIHCYDTNAATDYIKIWHDDVDANIQCYNATALNIGIDGTVYLELTTAALYPTSVAGIDLGTSALGFNDLHLDSGGVINFDGGDVTLTHSSDTLTLAGGLDANKSTGATVNVNGIYEILTVTGDCSGTVCGIRARATVDGTARTIENFFGGNFDARLQNAGDRITGIMAGLQVATSLGLMDVGAPWAYGINIDLTESGGARASNFKAFIDFQDYDFDGSYFCKSLFDIGGGGNRAATDNKAAKKLVCNQDFNGTGVTDGGIQIIVNGTPMWLATYAI